MYQPGDLVVYGSTGVCRVEGVVRPCLDPSERDREYYLLTPLYQSGVIYSPLEGGKTAMRPVISRPEAEALIDRIPTIHAEVCQAPTLQALSQHYQAAIRTHDCRDLVELVMSIYIKQKQAEARNRRLGMVDERYRRQAERLLYGELSVSLGIPYEEVQSYIASRVNARAGSKDAPISPAPPEKN